MAGKIKVLERDVQRQIVEYLGMLENMGRLTFIRNNRFAGQITRANGSKGFVNNSKPGSPDIYIFLKNGVTIHCEIKGESKQSEAQVAYQHFVEKLGHRYIIARSVDDVVLAVR